MQDSVNLNSYLDLISPVHHAKPRFMALASAVLIDNQDGTVTASLSEDTRFPLEELFPCPAGIRLSVSEA